MTPAQLAEWVEPVMDRLTGFVAMAAAAGAGVLVLALGWVIGYLARCNEERADKVSPEWLAGQVRREDDDA